MNLKRFPPCTERLPNSDLTDLFFPSVKCLKEIMHFPPWGARGCPAVDRTLLSIVSKQQGSWEEAVSLTGHTSTAGKAGRLLAARFGL